MERKTELRRRAWILASAYLVLIFGLSSIPQGTLSKAVFKVSDKLAHLAEYSGLGLLLTVAFRRTLRGARRWVLTVVVVVAGAIVGALDETYQLTVPGRDTDLLDWAADVLGVLVGNGVSMAFRTWRIARQGQNRRRSERGRVV
ncbi:MAG: VanZ family protein [Candidatus Eisenbacteria bacterium]|nr:VanZ family protein [Candidatus Eisenbacteria bacterium]